MGLVIACILPASLLAALLIYYDYQLTYKSFIDSAMATARANAAEVDKDFALIESALVAFSTSSDFSLKDLRHLDRQARKLVAKQNILTSSLRTALASNSSIHSCHTAIPCRPRPDRNP
jgi:hypothetical protein